MSMPRDGSTDQPEPAAWPEWTGEPRSGGFAAVPPPADVPLHPPLVSRLPPDQQPTGTWSGLGPETPKPRLNRPVPHWEPPLVRPASVTAAAVLLYIGAGLALLGCCGVTVLAGEVGDDLAGPLMFLTGILLFVAVINGVLGYFVMAGRQWARIVAIVLCGLDIVVSGFQYLADPEAAAAGAAGCFGVLLRVVIIALLSGREASDYFRRSG